MGSYWLGTKISVSFWQSHLFYNNSSPTSLLDFPCPVQSIVWSLSSQDKLFKTSSGTREMNQRDKKTPSSSLKT